MAKTRTTEAAKTEAPRCTPAEAARTLRGVSLNEVAAKLNRTPRHVREMERGTKPVPYDMAERMATIYGCRMEVFLRR